MKTFLRSSVAPAFLAFVFALIGAVPAFAQTQGQLAGCKLERTNQASLAQVAAGHFVLSGSTEQPVQIDCDELQLFADKVELFQNEGRVVAEGHIVFVSGTNRISAERMEFNTKTRTGTFYEASGTAIIRQGTPEQTAGEQEPYAFFWGDELHKVGPTKYKIVRGGFTACVQPTPRWEVSSGTLTLNLDDYVLLTNALFKVKGVPLLYLPVFYYPMQEDDRATGFVIPTYGTATHAGQKLSNGFFWALGRSHDLMFLHDWFTKTGQGMGARYRYMISPGSQGNARFYRLNEKSITTLINGVPVTTDPVQSYNINGDLVQNLGGGLRARGYADYFSSISSQQRNQQNVFHATNRTRRFGGNISGNWSEWVLNATLEQRDIFDGPTRLTRDGNLPRFSLSRGERAIGKSPLYFGVTGEYVTFVRKGLDTSGDEDVELYDQGLTRLDVNPTLRIPFTKWQFFTVNSSVSWRGTYWTESLNASRTQIPDAISRSYIDFQSRIVGPVFNKIFNTPNSSYAEKFKHVIEPSVTIQRVTAVDQFDRIVPLDGTDFVLGNVTRFVYSLANRFYAKKESSREILNIGIAQSYYTDARAAQFDRDFQSTFGRPEQKRSNYGPVALTVRAAPTLGIQGNFRTEYDHQFEAIRTIAASGTFNSSNVLQAEAGWSVRRHVEGLPGFEEALANHYLNASTTLRTRRNNFGGTYSFNYDLKNDFFLQQRYMAFYNAQCCGLSVEWQTFNLEGSFAGFGIQQDKRFNISFTLAGIGAVPNFFGALSGQQNRR
jgi:LPS-assembly protein